MCQVDEEDLDRVVAAKQSGIKNGFVNAESVAFAFCFDAKFLEEWLDHFNVEFRFVLVTVIQLVSFTAIVRLIDWPIDKLIDWLIDRCIERLIDWLIDWSGYFSLGYFL